MSEFDKFLKDPRVKFSLVFAGIFLASFTLLFMLGLVPNELQDESSGVLDNLEFQTMQAADNISAAPKPTPTVTPAKATGEEPDHITIPKINVDVIVQNPKTSDNAVLNEYLMKGTVRYPDSALLGAGNTLIFGHSSNLDVVHNQAYKAFSGLGKLVRGDLIYVDTATSRYTYSVTKVSMVKADEEYIDFSGTENRLTISTCNTLGSKEDRYVAEAVFENKVNL